VVRDYSFNSTHHTGLATLCNFVQFFCNDSEAIILRISALCPGGIRKTLEEIPKSYSFSENVKMI